MSSREPEIDYYVASTITCSDGGQVIFICGQKLVKTFDCLLYILRNISQKAGWWGAFVPSCKHRWKTVVTWHSYSCSNALFVSLSLSDIHLWKSPLLLNPSLAEFPFPSQILQIQHNPHLIPEQVTYRRAGICYVN